MKKINLKRTPFQLNSIRSLKKLAVVLMLLFTATTIYATDCIVSGAGSNEVNGTYVEDGTYNGKPQYRLGGTDFYVKYNDGWMGTRWEILDDNWGDTYYYTNDAGNTPPSTGWQVDMMGWDPAPSVTVGASSRLSYSPETFVESSNNDGTIGNTLVITYEEPGTDYFTGSDGIFAITKYTPSNVPSGLTMVITKNSTTELSVSLTGTAVSSSGTDDISNLGIAFNNLAFNNGDASAVINSTKSDLIVNYRDLITVASSGGDYTTIAAAIAAAGSGDIINISGETYTESGLTINKDLILQGQGATSTIVQAHASAGSASNLVFTIGLGYTVTIQDMTIQNGVYPGGYGGGIYSEASELTILNCVISDNFINTSYCKGGGIYSKGTLKISNSTISGNSVTSSSGYAYGGGVYSEGALTISNSTITGNSCTHTSSGTCSGGGIYCKAGTTEINNSTIHDNSCEATGTAVITGSALSLYGLGELTLNNCTVKDNLSGVFIENGTLNIVNTILANNDGWDFYVDNGTLIDNGYNIVEKQNTAYFTHVTDILFNKKADGTTGYSAWNRDNVDLVNQNLNISSTLADNNTMYGTQTLALLSGSFAIDAGTGSENDQRGVPVHNNTKDIGPYEFNSDWVIWTGGTSTAWETSGNWSTTPSSTSNIGIKQFVTNNPSLSSTATCKTFNIPENASLTIEDDGELTVSGTLSNSGTLTIESTSTGTGSLIVEGTATGDVTVQRYLTQGKWHYISAPVNDTRVFNTFLNLTAGANNDQFYWWDEDGTYDGNTGIWFDILNSPTGISYTINSFLPSQGYAITYAGTGSETISFIGVPDTETKTINITKTDASSNSGANLVGNPFCSTIAITTSAQTTNNFIAQNSSVLNDNAQAVYFWDESQNDYATKSDASGAIYADPGQGFMVIGKGESASLEFNVNTRKHGTASFYKNSNSNDISRVELLVNDSENRSNSTCIAFLPDMTFGLDPSYDAAKLKGNPDIALYTKLVEDNGVDFAIQALPHLNAEKVEVSLGLDVSQSGNYSFKLFESENFDETTSIKLEDKETGNLIDLRQIEVYPFNINEPGQIRNRFVLHFNNATGIEDQTPETENIRFYVYENKLFIIDKKLENGTIQLFNMLGQPVIEKQYSEAVNTFDLNLKTGYYVVRIITDKNTISGKIFIE